MTLLDSLHHRPLGRTLRSSRRVPASVGRAAVVAMACFTLACGNSGGIFTDCVATPDCSGGRQCFALGSGAGICLTTCPAEQALCAEGEACVPTASADEDWVCLPGGNVALGGVCSRSVDCDLGGVCVAEGSFSICRRACDPRVANCSAGTMCAPWTAERGYCTPVVQTPDMGVASTDGG